MVASPMDALKTFSWCDMDYLVFNNFVIGKENF
jgi:predicted NodU family carbamoyl transferase